MNEGAVAAGAAAAAEAQRLREEEEESLTRYAMNEVQSDYEFKIVRSHFGAFKNPDFFDQVIEEEKQNGWEFLEKFDDHRIRLKRRKPIQSPRSLEGIDPYRTLVGTTGNMVGLYFLCLIGSLFALGLFFLLLQ